MILTEEEAKTKTCPHMTYCVNPHHVAADKDPAILEQSPCLGSGCMAWRWQVKPDEGADPRWFPAASKTGRGYCGLSGKPEVV